MTLEALTALFAEDETTVLERLRGYANEGLSEADEDWTDTREGSFWWTCSMPGAREIARLYDMAGTDMVQAMLPQFSWGEYLNALAEVQQLTRGAATAAVATLVFKAPDGTVIPSGTQVATSPAEGSGLLPVQFKTTESKTVVAGGEASIACRAEQAGAEGNVAALAIDTLTGGAAGIESLSNPDPAYGGANEEGDEELAVRLLAVYEGAPVAQVRWYIKVSQKWLSEHAAAECPHGGRVSVKPLWNGAGTILVTISADSGASLEASVVEGLQAYLDPTAGTVEGIAPAAAEVTVHTGETLAINVTAKVTPKAGYNFTGSGGNIAIEAPLESLVKTFLDSMEAGEEVVHMKVAAVLVDGEGVLDVAEVKLNGAEANITPTTSQVPQAGTVTLTEA